MSLLKYSFVVGVLLLVIISYHQAEGSRQANLAAITAPAPQRSYTPPALPPTVFRLLGNRPAFFGGQLDAETFGQFLRDYPIAHVIDLAVEAKAEAILPNATERSIVESMGAHYYPLNIEGRGGALNEANLSFIDSLVETYEPVFIHCRNGLHRAKLQAARAYARDGYRWSTIVDLLQWHDVVKNSRYDRYTESAYRYAQIRNHPVNHSK